jgi:hypothetical protein
MSYFVRLSRALVCESPHSFLICYAQEVTLSHFFVLFKPREADRDKMPAAKCLPAK